MSRMFFFLVLSLTLQNVLSTVLCTLKVNTFLQYLPNEGSFVVCHHNASSTSTMGARLLSNGQIICETSTTNKTCDWTEERNLFKFPLNARTSQLKKVQCQVYNIKPLPVCLEHGEEIKLFPDSCSAGTSVPETNSKTSPCPCQKPGEECFNVRPFSLPGFLSWALIGLVLLLCLYSVTVTAVYIKIRTKKSEELYDTLTYVPMQVKPKKKLKRCDADKNTEYMDMREVHQQTGPFRDQNHNSHRLPPGFTI